MINNLSGVVKVLPMHMLTSLSVNEILLPRCVKWSTDFRGLAFNVEMAPSFLNYMNSVLYEFTQRSMPLAVCSSLSSGDSARADVFARNARSYA